MRWVFFSLLVINVVLFAYSQWQQHQQSIALPKAKVISEDSNGKTLILLSEMKTHSPASKKTIETVRLGGSGAVSKQVVGNPSGRQTRALCTLVGSFVDIAAAQLFVERLAVLDVQAKIKNLLVSTTVGYWLHLPPFDSRKALIRRLGELQRQGVDSYIIPDGDLENGISLGMFSEVTRAKVLQDKVNLLGYETNILEVPREKREIWVFIMQGESPKISEEQWLELLSGADLLQKQQNLCSDVASA